MPIKDLEIEEKKLKPEDKKEELAEVPPYEDDVEIDEELRRQISGAGQGDYKRASTYLRDRYYTLTSSPLPGDRKRAKDRTIEIMQCEIEDLEADLEGSIVKREDASISLEEHSEIDEEVEKCQKEFEEANKKRLALDHYDTLIEKFDSFNHICRWNIYYEFS